MSRSLAPSRLVALLLVPLAAALAACTSDPIATELPPEARIDTTTFAPSLGINLAEYTVTSSGLYYKDRVVGTSDSVANAGDLIRVHYIGWRPNGTIFDQSSPDAEPLTFTLGEISGGPIAGFQEGVTGMRVGGSRMVIIPPSLGYGYAGSPPRIGSNEILIFRIDLHTANGKAPTTTTGS
jgi:FKBP-type peptidyl-prolyl cis-trans isomerase FkpA